MGPAPPLPPDVRSVALKQPTNASLQLVTDSSDAAPTAATPAAAAAATDRLRVRVSNNFGSTTEQFSIDTSFIDEDEGTPCVDFNRTNWPHGKEGDAKPHSEMFVVTDGSNG